MDYDVIIIGAGLSGLSAGIRLAYYGRKVAIFERHSIPGGLNSYYRRNGKYVDVGLHAMTNYAEEGARSALLSKLFRQLRIKRSSLELCQQTYSLISFPGVELRLANSLPDVQAQIKAIFPELADGFAALCEKIASTDLMSFESDGLSARSVVREYVGDSLLLEMIMCPTMFYGNARADDMDFKQFCIMFQSIFVEGMARPKNGMQPFIDGLVEQFQAHGGELKLGCGIAGINCENGNVIQLQADDGRYYTAKTYISSIGALETSRICNSPQPILESAGCGQMGFVETIFNLSCTPCELGLKPCLIFRNEKSKFNFSVPADGVDFNSQVICLPGNFRGCSNASASKCARITAIASPEWWKKLNKVEYEDAKKTNSARLLEVLERLAPGISGKVTSWEMFTPMTIRRFTGHLNGAIYGAPNKIYSGKTDCENLLLCGTDQGYLGIIGSMLSGTIVANNLMIDN